MPAPRPATRHRGHEDSGRRRRTFSRSYPGYPSKGGALIALPLWPVGIFCISQPYYADYNVMYIYIYIYPYLLDLLLA